MGAYADTALRLARLFGTDAAFWMNLQAQYDLETADLALHTRIEQRFDLKVAAKRLRA